MSSTVFAPAVPAPLTSLENLHPRPAKAVLTSHEDGRRKAGAALARAIAIAGLSIKESAGLLDVDPAQLSRWIAGTGAIQLARILNCAHLHGPFVIALASAADGVSVDTVITVRRTA